LRESVQTLVEYRLKWTGIPADDFVDGESIFRTAAGHRLFDAWRHRWNLKGS
jgi:hypothetical protein